jgi:hypothetical protein
MIKEHSMGSETDINAMPKKNPLSLQIDLSKFEKATDEEKRQQDVMSNSNDLLQGRDEETHEEPAGGSQYSCTYTDNPDDSGRTYGGTV